jgi:hypothetical protein
MDMDTDVDMDMDMDMFDSRDKVPSMYVEMD